MFARRWWLLGPVIVLLVILPTLAHACSGFGAERNIERAERIGWALWAATLVTSFALGLVYRSRRAGSGRLWVFAAAVLAHPGWWASARSGDCGATLIEGSVFATALALVVQGLLCWRARPDGSSGMGGDGASGPTPGVGALGTCSLGDLGVPGSRGLTGAR